MMLLIPILKDEYLWKTLPFRAVTSATDRTQACYCIQNFVILDRCNYMYRIIVTECRCLLGKRADLVCVCMCPSRQSDVRTGDQDEGFSFMPIYIIEIPVMSSTLSPYLGTPIYGPKDDYVTLSFRVRLPLALRVFY